MTRRLPRLMVLIAALTVSVAAQTNLLVDGGFEQVAADGSLIAWTQPDYWSGLLASSDDTRTGERSAQVTAVERNGRCWGRIHSRQIAVTPGLRYRLSIWAKGSGLLKLGVVHYRRQPSKKPRYETPWQPEGLELTGAWQEAAYEFEPFYAEVEKIAVMIEVEGEGATALLDDAALEVVRRINGSLEVEPTYAMVRAGAEVTISARSPSA